MKKSSSLNIYIMLILAALEILISFTFLGYFHIPPISITFAYIPVVMAAYLLGPVGAAVIGAVLDSPASTRRLPPMCSRPTRYFLRF